MMMGYDKLLFDMVDLEDKMVIEGRLFNDFGP